METRKIPSRSPRLIARMRCCDDSPALGRLRTILASGFERGQWFYNSVVTAAERRIPSADMKLYRALADAILDESKVAALDSFERWKAIEPIPLDTPWPDPD